MKPGISDTDKELFLNENTVPAFFNILSTTLPKCVQLFAVNIEIGKTPEESIVSVMGIRPKDSKTLRALENAGVDVKGEYDRNHETIGNTLTDILRDAIEKGVEAFAKRERDAKERGYLCMTCKRRTATLEATETQTFLDLSEGICRKYNYPCTECEDYLPDTPNQEPEETPEEVPEKELEIIQMDDIPDEPKEAEE